MQGNHSGDTADGKEYPDGLSARIGDQLHPTPPPYGTKPADCGSSRNSTDQHRGGNISQCPGAPPQDPVASSSAARSAEDSPSADGPTLTLGSALLERMARLRAIDQYRELLAEVDAAEAAVRQGQRLYGTASSTTEDTDADSGDEGACADSLSSLLLRGALLIARHRYPALDEGAVYGMLDGMARRVAALLPTERERRYPLRVVAAINRVMYTDYGFRGNSEDYYNADNSCINRVMERRVGIPITLSLIYMEVARRVGLPMRGLNLPGHFMIQPVRRRRASRRGSGGSSSREGNSGLQGQQPGSAGAAAGVAGGLQRWQETGTEEEEEDEDDDHGPLEVLVDAFRGGEVCLPADAEERISDVLGTPVRIDPRIIRESQPLPPRAFLLRMLGNLRAIYLPTHQLEYLLFVLKYMRATMELPEEQGQQQSREGRGASPSSSSSASFASPVSQPLLSSPAALAAVARDEGLCYFALRRFPEAIESLREYLQADASVRPPEDTPTILAVIEEARRRMAVAAAEAQAAEREQRRREADGESGQGAGGA